MDSNCTDSTNEEYKLYWFNYFVTIGYIDSSDLVNLYAPYGKCTRSVLWLTYLINVVHFFLLSTGVLYLLNFHRSQSGFWWPFVTWISSFVFIVGSIALFILLNLKINLFSTLIIAFQISSLIILWISVFIVVIFTFAIEFRYQRCLYIFIIILFLLEICCLAAQVLITFHCLYNLKFISTFLDYGYWSAIIAAAGTIVSTLLMDYIFLWCRQGKVSARVSPVSTTQQNERVGPAPTTQRNARVGPAPMMHRNAKVAPAPMSQQNETENRATSPVDSVILDDFHREPELASHHVYNNNDRTRRFRIQPINQQPENLGGKQKIHSLSTSSEA